MNFCRCFVFNNIPALNLKKITSLNFRPPILRWPALSGEPQTTAQRDGVKPMPEAGAVGRGIVPRRSQKPVRLKEVPATGGEAPGGGAKADGLIDGIGFEEVGSAGRQNFEGNGVLAFGLLHVLTELWATMPNDGSYAPPTQQKP